MYSVWISLWIAMWAVLIVTLPFHVLLHGIVAYRIAQQEGWGAVFRKGRYLREIRQHRALSRMMLGWLLLAFLEICGLMVLSALVFTSRAEAASTDIMRVDSIPQSGDILLVGPNTLWRLDAESYALLPTVRIPRGHSIIATTLSPNGESVYLNTAPQTYGTQASNTLSTGIMHFVFDTGEAYRAFDQPLIYMEAISPDQEEALAQYISSEGKLVLCVLNLESGDCPSTKLLPQGRFKEAHWLPNNYVIALMLGDSSLIRLDIASNTWEVLSADYVADIDLIPDRSALLVHRTSDIAIYDLDSGTFEPVPNIRNEVQPVSLSVSPNGTRALMTTASNMTVFEIASGTVIYEHSIPIGHGVWMADSTRLVIFGDREDRVRTEYSFQPNLFNPIKTTQVNYPFTTLMIVNMESGEVERTLSLEDAPSRMILVP